MLKIQWLVMAFAGKGGETCQPARQDYHNLALVITAGLCHADLANAVFIL